MKREKEEAEMKNAGCAPASLFSTVYHIAKTPEF
jgi:hypothetical protein